MLSSLYFVSSTYLCGYYRFKKLTVNIMQALEVLIKPILVEASFDGCRIIYCVFIVGQFILQWGIYLFPKQMIGNILS